MYTHGIRVIRARRGAGRHGSRTPEIKNDAHTRKRNTDVSGKEGKERGRKRKAKKRKYSSNVSGLFLRTLVNVNWDSIDSPSRSSETAPGSESELEVRYSPG